MRVRGLDRAREFVGWLRATRPARAGQRYNNLRGNRLAGAVSFYGFVSLFPLLVLGGAIVSTVAGADGVAQLQQIVDDNLPGLRLNVSQFADNAQTLGVIGGVALLWTGLGWVDAMRAAVRSMWRLDDKPGNLVTRKLTDLVALMGLGVLLIASWGATVMVDAAADEVLELTNLTGTVNRLATGGVALALAIVFSSMLFSYLLAGLPRIVVPWRVLFPLALVGGLAYEVTKQVIAAYGVGVAPNSAYAAFAMPLALLAWIYVVTRLLMVLAAAMAEWAADHEDDAATGEHSAPREPEPGSVARTVERQHKPSKQHGE